jgi:Grx4 family monothiol glutaredoxin
LSHVSIVKLKSQQDGKPLDRLEGANAPALSLLAEKYAKMAQQQQATVSPETTPVPTVETSKKDLTKRLESLIKIHPIMIFIKGTPAEPRCGFSRQAIELLKQVNATYGSFDILSDETVRQGLKEYSNWPTFPQIYVHGELIGGLDILKEMIASGEFQDMMPKEETLEERLGKLVKKAPVMLFMKGNPNVPRCGFSKQASSSSFLTRCS